MLPVTSDEDRRIEVFERELWRIAVEHLPYGEQIQWAALAGARVAPSGWRRARAMLHFDREGAIKRAFLLTAVQRNKNPQLRVRALQEIAASRDGEAFDTAIDEIGGWTREERREGTKVMLLALAEKRIGRRDQANAWIWRLASYTRDVHEEYAVQRWPETKRLLGLLVNSSGAAHARNARRLVHAARKQDRRLSAALLAAAIAHSPEGEEILRGARTRLARKPSALSRELLRNFPKSRGRRGSRRRRKKGAGEVGEAPLVAQVAGDAAALDDGGAQDAPPQRSSRRSRSRNGRAARLAAAAAAGDDATPAEPSERTSSRRSRSRSRNGRAAEGSGSPETAATEQAVPTGNDRAAERSGAPETTAGGRALPAPPSETDDARAVEAIAGVAAALAAARGPRGGADAAAKDVPPGEAEPRNRSRSRRPAKAPEPTALAEVASSTEPGATDAAAKPKPRTRRAAAKPAATRSGEADAAEPTPRARRPAAKPATEDDAASPPKPRARRAAAKAAEATDERAPAPAKPRARRAPTKPPPQPPRGGRRRHRPTRHPPHPSPRSARPDEAARRRGRRHTDRRGTRRTQAPRSARPDEAGRRGPRRAQAARATACDDQDRLDGRQAQARRAATARGHPGGGRCGRAATARRRRRVRCLTPAPTARAGSARTLGVDRGLARIHRTSRPVDPGSAAQDARQPGRQREPE